MSVKVLALLAAVMVLASALGTTQAFSCSDVYSALSPCISYISTGGGLVPRECCKGVRNVLVAAHTGADLRTACGCLKNLAGGVSGENLKNAAAIPTKCGIPLPYKISPTVDCSKIK